MDVLVTGGSGFLGRHLVRQLADAHNVYATYATRKPEDIAVNWIPVRFSGREVHADLPRSVNAVIHLAQSSQYRDFPQGAGDMFDVNVAGTQFLLEYARAAGAQQFVLASTGSIYAGSHEPIREQDITSSQNYYAASKLAAELLCAPYRSLFRVCVLRLFYLYGPGQQDRLVPNLIRRVKNGEKIQINGHAGGLKLTPTFVADAAKVFRTALEQSWDDTLNVSGQEVLSIKEIGDAIGEVLGVDPTYERNGDDDARPVIPDVSKLSSCFDLSHFKSFAAGIAQTCRDSQ